ncbi:HEPACAM family member 2-like isoform X2 [Heterodontus francisci]|uniref:HEPACAM family member 2-like isoform X2 n=1 Tax=Heterodontus francisci TaxID=7792 RepID=UPI00355C0702
MALLLFASTLQIVQILTGRWSMFAETQETVIDGTIHQTVQLPLNHNFRNPSEVFNVEWRIIQDNTSRSILTFSPSSPMPFISDTFKNRVNFSKSTAELSLKNIQLTDEGTYEFKVTTSDAKSTKSSVYLTVNVAVSNPHIDIDPETPRTGDNVTLQCSVLEGNHVRYSWYRCDLPLSSGMNYRLSQNNSSLTLLNVQGKDIGTYNCKVTNRISSNDTSFVLHICPVKSAWSPYGYIGYGGYPGYIGYIIIIVLIYQWKKEAKIATRERDVIYENSEVKKKVSVTSSSETKIMCNVRTTNRRGR